MPPPGHILTICTANICRSPMAAGLLRHALAAEPEPLRSLPVISAGVAARTGEPVSENSVIALKKVGVDISGHFSRPLTQKLLDDALVVLCMTETHRALIELHFNPVPKHLYLLRQFMPPPVDPELDDPFGAPLRVYEICRDNIVEALPSVVAFLRTLVPPAA